ncbi:(d)CMP kinase [Candidatus Omnitrophota bacterium]
MVDIVAIDGPAGSGKSTVAKLLAKRLGYIYIDTGAMYRALTLKALRNKIELKNESLLCELASQAKLDIVNDDNGDMRVLLDSEDVTSLIRTPELTSSVAFLAKTRGVRDKMKVNQQSIGERGKCVFEGRDIGTEVFPKARYKFYLDADPGERIKRRHKEMVEKEFDVSIEAVARDVNTRDHKDMNREVAPLKRAENAIYIDTTNLTIDEVVEKLTGYIK